jgi:1-acyl-sn-glycerol-3-phosphate acyltransferase
VRSRKDQLTGILRGASLFGPRYLSILRKALSQDRARQHDAERDWARRAAQATGVTIETHGLHKIDPSEQYVIVPLHEGFSDVLALSLLPLDIAYSATEELFDWKLLGRYLAASGHSPVPLNNWATAYRAMIRDAEKAFSLGASYAVFPQGSILGIEIAFHQGAFRLSAHTGRPLLPVVLTGSSTVWEYPFSPNLNFGQTIRMEVLEPLDAVDAVHCAREVEDDMKQRALSVTPGPRRFEPDRDGWWDDYAYEIDPAFPDLAVRVAAHRKMTDDTRLTTHDTRS